MMGVSGSPDPSPSCPSPSHRSWVGSPMAWLTSAATVLSPASGRRMGGGGGMEAPPTAPAHPASTARMGHTAGASPLSHDPDDQHDSSRQSCLLPVASCQHQKWWGSTGKQRPTYMDLSPHPQAQPEQLWGLRSRGLHFPPSSPTAGRAREKSHARQQGTGEAPITCPAKLCWLSGAWDRGGGLPFPLRYPFHPYCQ